MIQITDDQVLNGKHLCVQHTYRADDVSSFLIQQGEGEVEEDGSSSSTTAWWWMQQDPGRASPSASGKERCYRGRGRRQKQGVRLPFLPPFIQGPWGAPALGRWISKGAAAKGGLPPKPSGGRPHP